MKTCTGCKQTKDFSQFSKNAKKPDGFEPYCKECKKANNKAYREKNAEALKIKKKAYADAHKEEISQKNKEYRELHREELNEYRKEWGKTHTVNRSEASKEKTRKANHDRYHNDPEFRAAKLAYEKARWAAKPEEERKRINQTYWAENRDKMAEYRARTKDHRIAYMRTYRESNSHYFILKAAEYNAKKRGNLVDEVPSEFLNHLCRWQDMKCFYCGGQLSRSSKTKELEHIIPVTKKGMNSSANLVWACLPCNDSKFNYLYGVEWTTERNVENIKAYNHCASTDLASKLGGQFSSGVITISWLKVIVLSSFGLSFGYPELSIEDIKEAHPEAVLIWDFVLDQNTDIVKDYILSLLDENASMRDELEPLVFPYKDQEYVYVNAEGSHESHKFNSENGPTWLLHYDESRTEEENALVHGYRKLYLY